MPDRLRHTFDRAGDPHSRRGKFMSRLLGIFSEELVSIWAADPRAPYENLGRPTLKDPSNTRGHTLDFTLRDRSTGKAYVAEMKCEIEYQNFRYFILDHENQLAHHKKPAFAAFLTAARLPDSAEVRVRGQKIQTHGAILIWGAIETDAAASIRTSTGLHDILSLEAICRDLADWQNPDYLALISQRREWCERLFAGLESADSAA